MNKEPLNLAAIREWVRINRPGYYTYFDNAIRIEHVIFNLTIGFEAGRQFQSDNPTIPLNEPMYYVNF